LNPRCDTRQIRIERDGSADAGQNKSRGSLGMICADFLAGAHLDNGNPEILLAVLQVPARRAAAGLRRKPA